MVWRFVRLTAPVAAFLLIAAFIWVLGPYFAFGDYRPLESDTARWIAIALVALGWVGWIVVKRLRAARAGDRLMAAVVDQAKAKPSGPGAEALRLRERFEEAVARLKKQRGSARSLYDLPWYVIIGAPGQGKTTLLVNSGLQFPVSQEGPDRLRGVGGTRDCDWWFTDDAVFLDTAGRYFTQDSDAATDSSGWIEFLELLRKYRGRRPINGVLLTIGVRDLLEQTPEQLEDHVMAARRRLHELTARLRVKLPVYLMVTKCDLVNGFAEYFGDLTQEGRAQVWGVTFPHGERAAEPTSLFPAEFDALVTRLNTRLMPRLDAERDTRRRAAVFAFPQQMAMLRDSLAAFVSGVFGSTRFDEQLLLRGVYFTSGTQEGTPIDRLLGVIGRRFAVAPEAVAPRGGRGKAFFVERLLKDVVLPESGLAGLDWRTEVRKAAWQLGAYAAMVTVGVVALVLLVVSYSRNRSYVEQVSRRVDALDSTTLPSAASLDGALGRLDAVATIDSEANLARVPLTMRMGLYQGGSLGDAARGAYAREFGNSLLPHLANRLEIRLTTESDPNLLYQYLKAYLMLGHPQYFDRDYMRGVSRQELAVERADSGSRLMEHFDRLLAFESAMPPVATDEGLIDRTRQTLRLAELHRVIYANLRTASLGDPEGALRLDVGGNAERVLRRRSGTPLTEPVPSLYTADTFKELTTGGGLNTEVSRFTSEDWVWGPGGIPSGGRANLQQELLRLYEDDYIRQWREIVTDIQPVSGGSHQERVERLLILGRETSPLRALLATVDTQTNFASPEEAERARGLVDRVGERLGMVDSAQTTGVSPGDRITAAFKPLHDMMTGANGAVSIDRILAQLTAVQQALQALDPRVISPGDPGYREAVIRLETESTALAADAARLPDGVRQVVTQIGGTVPTPVPGGVDIAASYSTEVLPQCRNLLGSYPFSRGGTDLALNDFSRVFGAGGIFDRFFEERVQPELRPGTRSLRPGTRNSDPGLLDRLAQADRIRELFFSGGSQPAVTFTAQVIPAGVSASEFALVMGDQRLEFVRGSIAREAAFEWPGQGGHSAISFDDRSTSDIRGPWSGLKLLEAASPQPRGGGRYVLTFSGGGQRAQVQVTMSSGHDLFEGLRLLRAFRCS